jgi:hypothetical protein
MKETEKHTKKMFLNGKTPHVHRLKESISKVIYRFNAVLIKIPMMCWASI